MTSTAMNDDDARPSEEVPRTPRRHGPSSLVIAVLGVVVLVLALFAYVAVRHRNQQNQSTSLRASGIPASVSTPLASLMALSPVPNRSVPDFTLTDQRGQTLSLSSFRGHAVVLEFMDPHCTDICPIVSQEFVDAYHDLGATASRVAFLAVNVNEYHAGVSDVDGFSREHQLNTIPSWHFFTGSVSDLEAVWQNYGIAVEAPNPNADIVHASTVFFIDAHGHQRYIATPMDDHTSKNGAYLPAGQIASWGDGIALVARQLVG